MKMKNIVMSLMSLMLLFGATSCVNTDNSSTTPSSQSESIKFHSLDEICEYINKKGYIDISTKNEMRADLIGAIKGYSFKGCEIYQYEKECPKNLTIYGISVPYSARNKKYGLYINAYYTGDKEAFINDFSVMSTE